MSKYSLLDNLSSQLKERCSPVAQSTGAEHTFTRNFTFGHPSIEMSNF